MPPIRIIIADDHRLFRQGLILLLKSEPEVTIVIPERARALISS